MDINNIEPVLLISIFYGTVCGLSIFYSENENGDNNMMIYIGYYILALIINAVINIQYVKSYNKNCNMSINTLMLNTFIITTIILGIFMSFVYVMNWTNLFNEMVKSSNNDDFRSVTLWYFFSAILASLLSLNDALSQHCIPRYD